MDADIESVTPVVTFKKRGKNANLRKRPATPPPASSDSEEYSSEDDIGRKVKRRRKGGLVVASSNTNKPSVQDLSATQYAADRSKNIESSHDATKQSNWYDEGKEDDLSTRNLLGKTRSRPQEDRNEPKELDGKYKGAASYGNFIKKNTDVPDRKFGPMKAATNIRTITITDFAPDVCKDYKQTGFCGFGDSCKFLHAREDYKQGWALDRDWEQQTNGKKQGGTVISSANKGQAKDVDDADAELLEKIPFACIICKKPYTTPIITKCGHYFCESCALHRYRKKPDCAVCGAGTNGVFNVAKDLRKLLDRKQAREERLKKKAEEEEEEAEGAS
jgi:RING finger protein 113A